MEGVSLRPGGTGSFRPGGGGLLTSFAGGSRPKPSLGAKEKGYDEVIKYDRDFLLAFKERCTDVPAELEASGSDVLLGGENEFSTLEERFGDRQAAKVALDERDWRARADPASLREADGNASIKRAVARSSGGRGDGAVDRTPLAPGEAGAEIVRAANPWTRAGPQDDHERLIRNVKGVLNKITPEKFDRLMEQLLELGINSAQALKETISLIFDKAVWEPTFCPLYAAMCVSLSKALPEFPPLEGEDKPTTFRRVLLNTCQEEFEGAANARAALDSIADSAERELEERKVKLRTLGNIRLIGELFKAKMIAERILHSCIGELLGKPKTDPPEENVEALVNLLVTVGKELDASGRSADLMDAYFVRLQQLSVSKRLASRLRFMCRDILDLRKNNWVPRREKLQAKKLDEVRADAAAALGIIKPQDDTNLFPEGPNGPVEDGWSVVGKNNKPRTEEGYSALTGQYVPPAQSKGPPGDRPRAGAKSVGQLSRRDEDVSAPSSSDGASPENGQTRAAGSKLTAEEMRERCDKMLAEFQSAVDVGEALLCIKDIQARSDDEGSALQHVCTAVVQRVVDESSERFAEHAAKLLVHLHQQGGASAAVLLAGMAKPLGTLDDLCIDVPKAPKLLGILLAGLLTAKALAASACRDACEKVGDMLTRRDLAVAVLSKLDASLHAATMVDAKDFLTDSDMDLQSLRDMFQKKGLSASLVPV